MVGKQIIAHHITSDLERLRDVLDNEPDIRDIILSKDNRKVVISFKEFPSWIVQKPIEILFDQWIVKINNTWIIYKHREFKREFAIVSH